MKTTIQTRLLEVSPQVAADLDHLMTVYQSCRRAAFKRCLEGAELTGLRRELAQRFPQLDARYRNDAIWQAQGVIDSQRALLPRRLAEVNAKIRQTARKLARVKDPLRRRGIIARLEKLESRRDELSAHLAQGTIPKVIFGQRRNFVRRHKKRISHAEWQRLRAKAFYSRGEKHKQGNLHTRLRYEASTSSFYLRVGFPRAGKRCRYEWFPLQVPRKKEYRDLLVVASQGQEAYSVEVLWRDGHYYAHVTLEEKTTGDVVWQPQADSSTMIAGIDLNLEHVDVTMSDGQGQYRGSRVYDCGLLEHARRDKRDWVIGNLARDIVADLVVQEVEVLVLEKLDIKQTHDTHARYNRRTVNFTYRRLHEALVRAAMRAGLQVKLAHPAYSSVIERLKYAQSYGISNHQAAAYVLARRGLGLRERLPRSLVQVLPTLVEELDELLPVLSSQQQERALRWRERLTNWRRYSPQESKHPWLLWATIDGVCKLTKRQLT
jgi:IS605 OrfB family transposase